MSVFSFSVKPDNIEGEALVLKVKKHATETNLDFSKTVLKALALYKKEVIDGDKSRNKN